MRTGRQVAIVPLTATVRDALFSITAAGAGCAFVTDAQGRLAGLLTDGDIRRALVRDGHALDMPATSWMNTRPIVIVGDIKAVEALALLDESERRPGEAPVLDEEGRPIGCIMLKDLLRCGIL
jgi:arabinose-5-phosphate isomerase